jgi:gamma-glutamylcyclotransferase (GGCT)/AIG2-like uncharacterized protein YtfP
MFGASNRASGPIFGSTSGKSFGVFVYGTLKPGEENYDRYCKKWVRQAREAAVRGRLFDLPYGYPALSPGDGWVSGFLLSFSDSAVLTMLDQLEDYDPSRPPSQNEYQRTQVQVFNPNRRLLGHAWVYQMQPERITKARGVWLPAGTWSNQTPYQRVSL